MTNLYINLQNCYGISHFENIFAFDSNNRAHLIYAPNGIMKTSFANTFSDIVNNQVTKDCFYPDKHTIRIAKYDSATGEDVSSNSILVIEPYSEKYKSEKSSVLLANASLKEQYDLINNDIESKFNLLSSLSSLSGKRDYKSLLTADFGFKSMDYYACLEQIYDTNFSNTFYDFSNIKYGKIVSEDAERIFQDSDVITLLYSYIEEYKRLLTESKIFKPVYTHTQAESTLNFLSKNGFFKAKHRIKVYGQRKTLDEITFKASLENEKNRIINEELSEEFKKIDNLLSAKSATQNLRNYIFENQEIIPELANYQQFKQKLWISYLMQNSENFQLAILNYKANKIILQNIINQARQHISTWNEVVYQFNDRFSNLPFKIEIGNKEDVILKNEIPIVLFKHKQGDSEIEVEENLLLSHLSNGEKKALYLLNVIFEIEARKKLNIPTFLIIDDIADSFDYRNKYAIIEYLKDICDDNLFMPIILTHNFDFYRTVAGRINIKKTSYFVQKTDTNISLVHGQYFENVFDSWRSQVYQNNRIFLSSIAFVRNLIEYTQGRQNIDYLNLTNLLHYKPNPQNGSISSTQLTVDNLITIYKTHWNRDSEKFSQNPNTLVIDIILNTAENIVADPSNEILIENKIVLSIAIRILAEKYMIQRINNPSLTDDISGNQTRFLRKLIHFNLTDENEQKTQEIIERVLIITSENIHINSFMYEPIVDLSLNELIKLYKDTKQYLITT